MTISNAVAPSPSLRESLSLRDSTLRESRTDISTPLPGGNGAPRESRVRVGVRVKPSVHGEDVAVLVEPSRRMLRVVQPVSQQFRDYAFDVVYPPSTTNAELASDFIDPVLHRVMTESLSAACLCYGQTGSGKTYSMGLTPDALSPDGVGGGIVPYVLSKLLPNDENDAHHEVRLEFLQQYLDQVYDLFDDGKRLTVREVPGHGVLVENSTLVEVTNVSDACEILNLALRNRKIGEVHLDIGDRRSVGGSLSVSESEQSINDPSMVGTKHLSSRSHALLTLHVRKVPEHPGADGKINKQSVNEWGKFTLGDLAGSERNNGFYMGNTDAVKLQEAKSINASLAALGNVISSLAKRSSSSSSAASGNGVANSLVGTPSLSETNNKTPSNAMAKKKFSHVPWRDSKLTKLLWDSLDRGGVSVLCTVHADRECVSETVSSLTFASRCKRVQLPNRLGKTGKDDQFTEVGRLRTEIKILKIENEKLRELGGITVGPGGVLSAGDHIVRTGSEGSSLSNGTGTIGRNGTTGSNGSSNVNDKGTGDAPNDITRPDEISQTTLFHTNGSEGNQQQQDGIYHQDTILPGEQTQILSLPSPVTVSASMNSMPAPTTSMGGTMGGRGTGTTSAAFREPSLEPRGGDVITAPSSTMTMIPGSIVQNVTQNGIAQNNVTQNPRPTPERKRFDLRRSVSVERRSPVLNSPPERTSTSGSGQQRTSGQGQQQQQQNQTTQLQPQLQPQQQKLTASNLNANLNSVNVGGNSSEIGGENPEEMKRWFNTVLETLTVETTEDVDDLSSNGAVPQNIARPPKGCEKIADRAIKVMDDVKHLKHVAIVQKNLSEDLIQHAALGISSSRRSGGSNYAPSNIPGSVRSSHVGRISAGPGSGFFTSPRSSRAPSVPASAALSAALSARLEDVGGDGSSVAGSARHSNHEFLPPYGETSGGAIPSVPPYGTLVPGGVPGTLIRANTTNSENPSETSSVGVPSIPSALPSASAFLRGIVGAAGQVVYGHGRNPGNSGNSSGANSIGNSVANTAGSVGGSSSQQQQKQPQQSLTSDSRRESLVALPSPSTTSTMFSNQPTPMMLLPPTGSTSLAAAGGPVPMNNPNRPQALPKNPPKKLLKMNLKEERARSLSRDTNRDRTSFTGQNFPLTGPTEPTSGTATSSAAPSMSTGPPKASDVFKSFVQNAEGASASAPSEGVPAHLGSPLEVGVIAAGGEQQQSQQPRPITNAPPTKIKTSRLSPVDDGVRSCLATTLEADGTAPQIGNDGGAVNTSGFLIPTIGGGCVEMGMQQQNIQQQQQFATSSTSPPKGSAVEKTKPYFLPPPRLSANEEQQGPPLPTNNSAPIHYQNPSTMNHELNNGLVQPASVKNLGSRIAHRKRDSKNSHPRGKDPKDPRSQSGETKLFSPPYNSPSLRTRGGDRRARRTRPGMKGRPGDSPGGSPGINGNEYMNLDGKWSAEDAHSVQTREMNMHSDGSANDAPPPLTTHPEHDSSFVTAANAKLTPNEMRMRDIASSLILPGDKHFQLPTTEFQTYPPNKGELGNGMKSSASHGNNNSITNLSKPISAGTGPHGSSKAGLHRPRSSSSNPYLRSVDRERTFKGEKDFYGSSHGSAHGSSAHGSAHGSQYPNNNRRSRKKIDGSEPPPMGHVSHIGPGGHHGINGNAPVGKIVSYVPPAVKKNKGTASSSSSSYPAVHAAITGGDPDSANDSITGLQGSITDMIDEQKQLQQQQQQSQLSQGNGMTNNGLTNNGLTNNSHNIDPISIANISAISGVSGGVSGVSGLGLSPRMNNTSLVMNTSGISAVSGASGGGNASRVQLGELEKTDWRELLLSGEVVQQQIRRRSESSWQQDERGMWKQENSSLGGNVNAYNGVGNGRQRSRSEVVDPTRTLIGGAAPVKNPKEKLNFRLTPNDKTPNDERGGRSSGNQGTAEERRTSVERVTDFLSGLFGGGGGNENEEKKEEDGSAVA